MLDTVIEGNVYLDGKINKCCIGIEDGIIVTIKKILKGEQHLDYGDKLILPAGIDIHVHFRDPGYTNKEDFGTGTMAAAFGGIGSVFDMPNTKPPVISRRSFIDKLEIVSKKAYIDFGLYSSITPRSNISEISKVCSAFKIFLGETTGKLVIPNEDSISSTLYTINKAHRIPAIHAESKKVLQQYSDASKPPKNLLDHLQIRPNIAEAEAVRNILTMIDHWEASDKQRPKEQKNPESSVKSKSITSKHVHFCHVSTSEVVELLRKRSVSTKISSQINSNNLKNSSLSKSDQQKNQSNKAKVPPSVIVTSEVTPHHLLLNVDCDKGTFGKVNPPLRRPKDQSAVWQALIDGTIQILASDHAPHTIEEKEQRFGDSPAGIPGVETMLPLMLSYHKHHRIPLGRLISASAEIPANIFGLPKGRIAPGLNGDLIVVDFYKESEIKSKNLHSKCAWTPYEKMVAIFPLLTMVRGKIIVKDGNLESDMGFGRFHN